MMQRSEWNKPFSYLFINSYTNYDCRLPFISQPTNFAKLAYLVYEQIYLFIFWSMSNQAVIFLRYT